MWLDPAKWNAMVSADFALDHQLRMLGVFGRFYVQNFVPLLFLFFLISHCAAWLAARCMGERLGSSTYPRCLAWAHTRSSSSRRGT